jgi:hypothetical protein
LDGNKPKRKNTNDAVCEKKIYRIPYNNKMKTGGVFFSVYNCGIACAFKEIIDTECPSGATQFLLQFANSFKFPKFIIYDNACHLEEQIEKNKAVSLLFRINGHSMLM